MKTHSLSDLAPEVSPRWMGIPARTLVRPGATWIVLAVCLIATAIASGHALHHVRARSRPGFEPSVAIAAPGFVAVGGLCLSLLVFAMTRCLATTRQRAAALARQMTDKLRLQQRAMESSNEGIFILDATREHCPIIYANPAFVRLTGYAAEECLGDDTLTLLRSDTTRTDLPGMRSALQAGGKERTVVREYRKDGTQFWAEFSLARVRDERGRVTHYVGIAADITERRQAELALRESEERLALVIEGSNDGIWDWNVLTNAVYFSPRWKSMLGFEDDEIENNFAAWERLLHPEDRERALARIQAYFSGRSPTYELEHRLRHKDGSYRWILARGVALRDAEGRPSRMAGSHVDLTDRKQAEEALRRSEQRVQLALDGADLGLWDWNIVTDDVYFSDRWLGMLGYTRSDPEVPGTFWDKLIHPEDAPRVLSALQDHLAGTTAFYETEHRCRTKTGEYRWILDRGKVVQRDGARPIRMAGTHLDITERRQAEERLRQAYTELARSEEAQRQTLLELQKSHAELKSTQLQLIQAAKLESLGTLAAGVAHEVKNPLQTILMGLEYLTRNLPGVDQNAALALGDMRDAVQRANAIVRELLQFSAAAQFDLHEENLNSVVERSLQLLHSEFIAARVEAVRDFQDGLPPVRIDKGKIEQVLINLFINALQAMTQSGTLTVRTRAARFGDALSLTQRAHPEFQPGEPIVIAEVRDTGPGIPVEQLPKVFDPFFTTKAVGVGTGLGLSVVKKIVDLHGGAIEVSNAPEGGALVTLALRAEPKGVL